LIKVSVATASLDFGCTTRTTGAAKGPNTSENGDGTRMYRRKKIEAEIRAFRGI
jgi:hypothetical protein